MKEDWKEIVEHFGIDEQIKHWFTEVYELIQAIERDDGSLDSRKKIISELADNFNFLSQIQTYYDIRDYEIQDEQKFKNKRTLNDIGKETKFEQSFTGYKLFVDGKPIIELEYDNTEKQEENKKIKKLNKNHFHKRQRQLANKINELVKAVNELKNKE